MFSEFGRAFDRKWPVNGNEATTSVFCWGGKGKACDTAGWCHNVLAGYARYISMDVATLFSDIEKFYEFVSHEVLMSKAEADSFPLDLLQALCGLYAGARVAVFDGLVSDAIDAGGTIVAGCSCATVLAKVLVYRLLKSLSAKYAGLHLENVVDDFLQMVGTLRYIQTYLGRAGSEFAEGIRALRLPLSSSNRSPLLLPCSWKRSYAQNGRPLQVRCQAVMPEPWHRCHSRKD